MRRNKARPGGGAARPLPRPRGAHTPAGGTGRCPRRVLRARSSRLLAHAPAAAPCSRGGGGRQLAAPGTAPVSGARASRVLPGARPPRHVGWAEHPAKGQLVRSPPPAPLRGGPVPPACPRAGEGGCPFPLSAGLSGPPSRRGSAGKLSSLGLAGIAAFLLLLLGWPQWQRGTGVITGAGRVKGCRWVC